MRHFSFSRTVDASFFVSHTCYAKAIAIAGFNLQMGSDRESAHSQSGTACKLLTLSQVQYGKKIMGLFNQIVNAINNPTQEANSGQLANILSTARQLGNSSGASFDQVQSVMSIVGNFTRSTLQEKRATQGERQVQSLVGQFSGNIANTLAVQTLFSAPQIQQIVQVASEKTGLDPNTIQSMLPAVVPLVLNLLQAGSQNDTNGQNTVLSSFLDADGDGDVDISDVMKMASRFLS